MEKKIKVAWICHLSNEEIRKSLNFRKEYTSFLKKTILSDYAKWNTNAINEFKKFDDIELHIISPHTLLLSRIQEFVKEGIHYHMFRSEDDCLLFKLKRKFLKGRYRTPDYAENIRNIVSIIDTIKPDLVHVIGAENPIYSSAALSISKDTPLIVALQTLMIDPEFFANYHISKDIYDYRSGIERNILQRADYISCRGQKFVNVLRNEFGTNVKILDMPLVVGEKINALESEKEYDFVYFAKDIEKAADWAIEAFALAHKKQAGITMNIIGCYMQKTKFALDKRLNELGITDKITFSGSLPTHDDVIKQVRKARFALLPLKIDLVSGTIREAMANGLPVVTTITPATPKLNEARESLLLSEKEDHKAMAENMLRLLNSTELAARLKSNAFETIKERYDNETIARLWREAYYAILENRKNGTPIPDKLMK